MGCLTSNKLFDFCADLEHYPYSGILNKIFPLWDRARNFGGLRYPSASSYILIYTTQNMSNIVT